MPSVINPRSVSINLDRAEDNGIYYNKGDQILRGLSQLFGYDFSASSTANGNLQSAAVLTEAGFSGWSTVIGLAITYNADGSVDAVAPQEEV